MAHSPEAIELTLYATNNGDLYQQRALPIIANLARKIVAEKYDEVLALGAWRYLADDAARKYTEEFKIVGNGPYGAFSPSMRKEATPLIAAHYQEQLQETADKLRADKANRRTWTLAAIRAANEAAGFFFFSHDTMRAFGDTMRSFAVRCFDGKVFIQRVRPMRDRDGRNMGGIGELREFNPQTGNIGVPIKGQ